MIAPAVAMMCAIPMPLAQGQKPEDRDIAAIHPALSEAFLQSLQGEAPVSSLRFRGEAAGQREWVIAERPVDGKATRMLRLRSDTAPAFNRWEVRMGDATLEKDGSWNFVFIGEGACNLEQPKQSIEKSGQ